MEEIDCKNGCGRKTAMMGTKLCDHCWGVERAATLLSPLYVVIRENRHADVTVHPFTDKEKAISEARRIAKKYCKREEDYAEIQCKENDEAGWVFYTQYSCENDSVRVVEVEINKELS